MPPVRRTLPATLVVLALTSCGSEPNAAPDSASDPSATETTVQPNPPVPSSDSPPPSGVVALAIADLADELGVDEAEVEVVATEEVTWSDGSIGCARRGMSYTQALVDGSRITLRVAGIAYEYHSAGSRAPFRCDRPTQ